MTFKPSSKEQLSNDVQLENAHTEIFSIDLGKLIFLRLLQFSKALLLMLVIVFGITTSSMKLQFLKALSNNSFTPKGMIIFVSFEFF